MKRLIKYIKRLFAICIVRRSYWIIYQTRYDEKVYYTKDSMWTTDIDRATKYKKHPTLFWMGIDHLTMKV